MKIFFGAAIQGASNQKDYWPNNLSTMIRGITKDEVSDFVVKEYDEPGDAAEFTPELLEGLSK